MNTLKKKKKGRGKACTDWTVRQRSRAFTGNTEQNNPETPTACMRRWTGEDKQPDSMCIKMKHNNN